MNDLDNVRRKLEEIAEEFSAADGHKWRWDETKMHLSIDDRDGSPIATLHVERAQ